MLNHSFFRIIDDDDISPLKPIRDNLCLLKAISFPFKFEDAAATKVISKKGFGIAFFLLTLVPNLIMISYFILLGYIGMQYDSMTLLATYFSPLSKWDVYSVYTISCSASVIPFILHKCYTGMEAGLTKFAQIYSQVMHGILCKEDVLEVYAEVTTQLLVLRALALIINLLIDAFYAYMLWYLMSLDILIVQYFAWIVVGLFQYFPFHNSMAIALTLQSIGCWDRALYQYEQITLKWNQNHENKVACLISRGFPFIELNQIVNNMFGGLILAEYGLNLFYTTFGIYFSTTIINVYNTELGCVDKLVLFFASYSIMLVILSISRIYILQAKGQRLSNKYARIRQNLENISITFADKLERKEERQLEVLISHFSATTSPIRPCDVFNMDTANFVSVGGLIITYLIVLLQFKLGDSNDTMNMTLADVPKFLGNRTVTELLDLMRNNNATIINNI